MKKPTTLLAIASAILVTACGGSNPEPQNPNMNVVIVIRNNWIPVATVNAFVQPLGSRRRLLGTVQANATETFIVPARDVASGFTLVAVAGGNRGELESRRINETGGWMHTWNLAANIVTREQMP
jgi:hypothetical protein